ncbi:hypothetical protein [Sphingobacterium faecium]|uniref:hypothetical protein n=1 Tax=Sphingobacterium faecium TaxID=34087 RepID=UPI00320A475B
MAIRPDDLKVLEKANINSLKLAFGNLYDNLADESFLHSSNFLSDDAASIIDKQYSKKPRKRKKKLHRNVSEYIAASSLLHNMDGWTYFGQAIVSLLRGDFNTAKHLLYYSELRSCMSFLASNGIGVFNSRHLIINKNGKVVLINDKVPNPHPNLRGSDNKIGTHDFTWDALNNIINCDKTLKIVFDNYYIEGIALNDWLGKFEVNESYKLTIARRFLKLLSFDIEYFAGDKDARNQASYRPTNIIQNNSVEYNIILKDIKKIWEFSKPIGRKGEISIDIALLSELLQMAFKYTQPFQKSFKAANKQYNARLNRMLDSFGISQSRKDQLKKYFNQTHENIYEPMSLVNFKKPEFIRGIIYRSFLFLRLSNTYNKTIISNNSNINKDSLSFWWRPLGVNFGLWEEDGDPEDFQDLWEDIDMYADDLNDIIQQNNYCTSSFWKKHSNLAFLLGTCNRIGLWGLGI